MLGYIKFNKSAEAIGSDPNKALNQVQTLSATKFLTEIGNRYHTFPIKGSVRELMSIGCNI